MYIASIIFFFMAICAFSEMDFIMFLEGIVFLFIGIVLLILKIDSNNEKKKKLENEKKKEEEKAKKEKEKILAEEEAKKAKIAKIKAIAEYKNKVSTNKDFVKIKNEILKYINNVFLPDIQSNNKTLKVSNDSIYECFYEFDDVYGVRDRLVKYIVNFKAEGFYTSMPEYLAAVLAQDLKDNVKGVVEIGNVGCDITISRRKASREL